MVISNDVNSTAGESFLQGIHQASKDLNVVVEINEVNKENIEDQLKSMDMAIAANVDGIICHVTDREKYTQYIDKAIEKQIPVITVFEDAPQSMRQSYIGTNSFEIGKKAGKLVSEAVNYKGEIAIIESFSDTSKNLIETGFRDITNKYPQLEIKAIEISQTGILGAEYKINEIINNYPNINVIFCTSSKDTIQAAQLIVDRNKVGEIGIIGYGDSKEILKYIELGVIQASLVSDTYEIGYKSLNALVEVSQSGTTSSFLTGVNIITEENVHTYNEDVHVKEGDDR